MIPQALPRPLPALAGILLALAASLCQATTASVVHEEKLRDQPYAGATTLMMLHRLSTVRVLEERREWVRVEADGNRSGWVRDSSLRIDDNAAPTSAPSRPATTQTANALPRSAPRASNHALILGIADYPGSAALPGVTTDLAAAVGMARLMGVPDGNIHQLSDGQLKLEGLRKALVDLDARIGDNNRVFIYFAGHGSRGQEGGKCAEGLLTHDQALFSSAELALNLRALARKAGKLLVFIDAGRSPASRPGLTSRFFTPTSTRSCDSATGSLAKDLQAPPGARNVLLTSAGQDAEPAFETNTTSGIATQAFFSCISGTTAPSAAAGMPSAEELRQCAQPLMNARLNGAPQHLALAGNRDLIPSPGLAPATTGPVTPRKLLQALHAQRDERRSVSATRSRGVLAVTSSEPGYLYALQAGADGRSFELVYPNASEAEIRIEARLPLRLPRQGNDASLAEGVPLLILVTDGPRSFTRAGFMAAGPIASTPSDARSLRDLPLEVLGGDNSPACTQGETRNLGPQQARRCSAAFGSALLP